ncbi:unnamed protein product [Angiostrongylus costaricensis]|uniref:ADF-H domain-containing protein n=1 Tax=Angiostrongylus costaricensis TaxID=334426 RepID=A0A0R3PA48_ANGCS|nr:unnamed protein product [Angiostrongylus costaricensis]
MRNAIRAVEEKKTKTATISNTRLPTKLADVGIEGKKSKKEPTGRLAEKAIENCFARDNNGCRNGEEKAIKRRVGDEGAAEKQGKSKNKTTNEGRRRYSSSVGHSGNDDSPCDPPTLEAHVEAIRERRIRARLGFYLESLPRTILIDPTTQVEIVIGDDGKPYFQSTVTPKTEIFEEFAGILLEEDNEEGCKKNKANIFYLHWVGVRGGGVFGSGGGCNNAKDFFSGRGLLRPSSVGIFEADDCVLATAAGVFGSGRLDCCCCVAVRIADCDSKPGINFILYSFEG